ncbi:MAG: hypothetical protein K2X82_19760, partial [Gemmataceae bacterium]|nr:hypothetical protein [Gemmataceae bacterium]
MTRRLLGPAGGAVIFLAVAGLVFAGLGWVTVAALRVERERGEAAAVADRGHDLRAALWRLDARLLQALGVEDARPFHHYTRHEPGAEAVGAYGPASAPLLAAELPDWMLLHAEFDPDGGWRSPQVLPDEAADDLRARWPGQSLRNADPGRAKRYDALVRAYPKAHAARVLAAQERALSSDHPFAGGLLFMGPPAPPRPAGQEPARRAAAPKAAPNRGDREDGVRLQRAERRFEENLSAVEKEAVQSGLGVPPTPAGADQAPTPPDDAAAGRSANRPDARDWNSRSRANVIQRGAADAKGAASVPYYQNVGPPQAPSPGALALNTGPVGPPPGLPGGTPPSGAGVPTPGPGGFGGAAGTGLGGPPAGGAGGFG